MNQDEICCQHLRVSLTFQPGWTVSLCILYIFPLAATYLQWGSYVAAEAKDVTLHDPMPLPESLDHNRAVQQTSILSQNIIVSSKNTTGSSVERYSLPLSLSQFQIE